jgi:prepilin-type processing-associated H-X9-DG protein
MAQGFSGQTGNLTKVRELFACPDAPPEARANLFMSASMIHYECHPILMPQLLFPWRSDALRAPYKIAKVRRSSEIALIWDAPLDPTNEYRVKFEVPVSGQIDSWAIFSAPWLTDNYAGTSKNPGQAVNMTAAGGVAFSNTDSAGNYQTIRFRHKKDTMANALMVDGHVESFTYDAKKSPSDPLVTTLKRRNIYVNAPN